jgi:hypothetical protein
MQSHSRWVVAEENPGNFVALRLVPVFERVQSSGAGVYATDHPSEAVDAVIWACQREGISLDTLTVTARC